MYRRIDARKARELHGRERGAVYLDVRTEEEYRERRIPNALLLPDYDIAEYACELLPDADACVLIYCRRGNRSRIAALILSEMGYTNVYDFGSINDWPYETECG